MKPYPTYKPSGIEWLGEIPEHWKALKLKYLSSINSESLPETTASDYLMNYVEISDVSEETGIENKVEITFGSAPSRARRIVKEKDIILSTVRTYLKAIAFISNSIENQIVSTGFAVIRINENKLNPLYAYYSLRSDQFLNRVVANSFGVSYPAINSSSLANLSILVPYKDEQCAIEKYLSENTRLIDTLIEKKQKLIDLLREYRTAIINQAVTKGLDPNVKMKDSGIEWLGEVPEHWGIKNLKLVSSIFGRIGFRGYTKEDLVEENEGALTIGGKHISKENKLNLSDPEYIKWSKYFESPEIMVKIGDILLTQRGSLGKIAIIEEDICEATINPSVIILKNIKVNNKYLYYCLCGDYIQSIVSLISSSTAVPMISQELISSFKILIPSPEEQDNIVQTLNQKLNLIETQIEKEQNFIEYLKEYRTALISEVVTGKVDVRIECG